MDDNFYEILGKTLKDNIEKMPKDKIQESIAINEMLEDIETRLMESGLSLYNIISILNILEHKFIDLYNKNHTAINKLFSK